MARSAWATVSLGQLTGVFDARSRPADLAPGVFRWKQNFGVSVAGKLCRRAGFRRLFSHQPLSTTPPPELQMVVSGQPIGIVGLYPQIQVGVATQWRVKDGKVQGYNPDTGLWHTLTLTGTPPQLTVEQEGEL